MNPKDEIKDRLSIVEVISSYIKVEKSGSQYKARCPFHNERTPSFYISPERKTYHCFGCGAHGDIFTFVEKVESLPFVEALRMLGERAGVSLSDFKKNEKEGRLISLLESSTAFYESCFAKSPEAKTYLSDRGLSEETEKIFRVGYAPNEWRHLFIHLASQGYSPEEMEESGLVIKALDAHGKVKGWYDRFRGRIMFPIRNIGGRTVGFSGRIMPQFVDEKSPQGKYVNTPETPLYHKSKILFGYDTAKKRMMETKEVVVVEGQMDLCMSYQAGVHNTIAVSGTAFTDEHIKLIKRFAEKVILSFDSDRAGIAALKKSAKLCLFGGLDVYAVISPLKDPADIILEDKEKWHTLLSEKTPVILYLVKRLKSETKDERELRHEVKSEILPLIAAIPSALERDYFLTKVSDETGIEKRVLESETVLEVKVAEESLSETKQEVVHSKESRKIITLKKLVALVRHHKLEEKEELVSLLPDFDDIPSEIIDKEMYKIAEEIKESEVSLALSDLIIEYKKEKISEEMEEIKKKMAEGEVDDVILQKLHLLSKEKERLHKK